MKRDFDLIRNILFAIEREDGPINTITVDDYDPTEVSEHVKWLQQAGYIDALTKEMRDGSIHAISIRRLTWDGCELLDSIRDENVWVQVKQQMLKTSGAAPVNVLRQIAERVTLHRVMAGI